MRKGKATKALACSSSSSALCSESLTSASFGALLRSCANSKALSDGLLLHHDIIKHGLEDDNLLRNLLIQMYGDCGCSDSALVWFNRLRRPDRFAWHFIIKAFARQGRMEEALLLFDRMHLKGIFPDKFAHATILSGCTTSSYLHHGTQMHALLYFRDISLDAVVGTALVNMYGKCGQLVNAEGVFGRIGDRDVVAWNAMMSVYDDHERGQDAIKLFIQMQSSRAVPDKYTFVTVLSACTSQSVLSEGRLIHGRIVAANVEAEEGIGNALVFMYSKCGCLDDARITFNEIHDQSLLAWTAILAGYAQHGLSIDVLQLLDRMQWEGVVPDRVAFIGILAAFSSLSFLKEGKRMHARIVSMGFDSDVVMQNALLNMYIDCDSLQDARQMFEQMDKEEVPPWTTMVVAYVQHNDKRHAFELFQQMRIEGTLPDKVMVMSILSACSSQVDLMKGKQLHVCICAFDLDSEVTVGNALISMYGRCGILEDSVAVFLPMRQWNDVTFISILAVSANHADFPGGKLLHSCILESGLDVGMVMGSALLTMYSRCGSLADAQYVFDGIPHRVVSLWNAMIGAYAQNGEGKYALQLFESMLQGGVTPDEVTFVSVLSACSRAGLVDEASKYFVSMSRDYNITPDVGHYNCMVDLFGRIGQLEEAEKLIRNMPVTPTSTTWNTLLDSCRKQMDVRRGEYAAEQAFELDPRNKTAYVALASLYSSAGKEGDAATVVQWMQNRVLKQQVEA